MTPSAMNKKVVAVIPVFGRRRLLPYTISRLLNKCGVDAVVCVGSNVMDMDACKNAGAVWVNHANIPLGAKWNAGFVAAWNMSPSHILFVGSSDFVCDNWLSVLLPFTDDYDLVGVKIFHQAHVHADGRISTGVWNGYEGKRSNEPIGIGRIITSKALSKMNFRPFNPSWNRSMDFSLYNSIIENGGRCHQYTGDDVMSLSVSCDLWENMHRFGYGNFQHISDVSNILSVFPEVADFSNNIKKIQNGV